MRTILVAVAVALIAEGASAEPVLTKAELCEAYAKELAVAPSSYERKFLLEDGDVIYLEHDSLNEYGSTVRTRIECQFKDEIDDGFYLVERLLVGDTEVEVMRRPALWATKRVWIKHRRQSP